jgi:hypothetical protein
MKNILVNIKIQYIILFFALIVFAINQIPFLSDIRPIMYDESWYINPAYNLLNGNGLYNTIVGSGGNANFLVPMLITLFMKVFGTSLFAIRLTSVFLGFISLLILHLIFNEQQVSSKIRIIGYSLFLSILLINSLYRFVRPEFAVFTFTLLGILFTLRYIKSNKLLDVIGLSLSVLLASVSHPFSLYFFFIIGIYLLVVCAKKRNLVNKFGHLLLLVSFAVLAIVLMTIVTKIYNDSSLLEMSERVTEFNIFNAYLVSMKHVFVKHAIYTLPFLCINILSIIVKSGYKWLSIINLFFVFTFPLVFSGDLNMVGINVVFFTATSIVITIIFLNEIFLHRKYANLVFWVVLLFCLFNYSVSLIYNYRIKYERCNSVLQAEINEIIPDNSVVFGALRLWPFKMKSVYYSDHYRKHDIPASYDYLLINSQDELVYETYNTIKNKETDYKLIFKKETKQYGLVTVWRNKLLE